jgi:hypothetical protein
VPLNSKRRYVIKQVMSAIFMFIMLAGIAYILIRNTLVGMYWFFFGSRKIKTWKIQSHTQSKPLDGAGGGEVYGGLMDAVQYGGNPAQWTLSRLWGGKSPRGFNEAYVDAISKGFDPYK